MMINLMMINLVSGISGIHSQNGGNQDWIFLYAGYAARLAFLFLSCSVWRSRNEDFREMSRARRQGYLGKFPASESGIYEIRKERIGI